MLEEFGQALGASPKGHADLQGKARLEAFQKTFFQLSIDFPILTDWVMQDAGPDAWQIVLPEKREQMMEKLFQAHGVSGSSSLKEYAKLCEKRRTERLSSALKEWAPFTFTEGVTVRNSFFAYTEGLSDARHERFFEPGARLSTLSFDDGSVYGTKKSILDDAHGMMRDVDVSFDKQKLLIAWKKSDRLDDYHIYEYNIVKGVTSQTMGSIRIGISSTKRALNLRAITGFIG